MNKFFLLIFFSLLSCRTSTLNHGLKHEWDANPKSGAQLDCKEDETFATDFRSYMRRHLSYIASGSPHIFKDAFHPDKFCLMPIDDPSVNAGASSQGLIAVNIGLIKAVENDAQFGAALAHEVAHVIRQHGKLTPQIFKSQFPEFTSYDEKDVWRHMTLWLEKDADELGLELYIRAGYEPSQFSGFFTNLTQRLVSSELGNDHASDQERANNIEREASNHHLQIESLNSGPKTLNFFDSPLSVLKDKYVRTNGPN